jgi:hypothetical protein
VHRLAAGLARHRRQLIIGSLSVVLLVAGAIMLRLSGNGSAADSSPDAPSATTTPPPSTTNASAPSADNQPAAPAGSTTTPARGAVGDVEVPLDPSGARTTRSEAGTRQAAIDYLSTVRQRLVYLNEETGRLVLADWAAPGVAVTSIDGELEQAAMLRNGLSADGGDVWWIVSPLAARVDAYSGDRARVSVWLSSVIGAGADPHASNESTQPMSRYQTDTVELVWADGRWTVWATSSVDGPTPMTAPSSVIVTPEAFITSMSGFSLIRRHL